MFHVSIKVALHQGCSLSMTEAVLGARHAVQYLTSSKPFITLAVDVQEFSERRMRQDSANRLNDFIESMRRDVAADLAAKNLGDEGCGYIAEGLAFNTRCH